MAAELMKCLVSFQLIDIFGFAKLVGIKEERIKEVVSSAAIGNKDYQEFICDIVEAFNKKKKKQKEKFLRMAREVKENNDEFDQIQKNKDLKN